jgi:hypothetical protein
MRTFPFWKIFAVLFVISGSLGFIFNPAFQHSLGGDRARFATTESLVERGTFAIDDSPYIITIDKVYINGHFYGCQTPLMPILMALFYYPLFNLGISFISHSKLTIWILTLIFNGSASAGTSALMGLIHFHERGDLKRAIYFSGLFFLGTLYLSYSVLLNNHTFSGFLIFLAIYLILYCKQNGITAFFAGLVVTIAGVTDPPAGIAFAIGLLIYQISKKFPPKIILTFILGGIAPAIAHIIANHAISGSIFPTNIKPEYFIYPGAVFDESNLSGVVFNSSLKELVSYAFQCLFGVRGWFSYTPILLFGILGALIAVKSKADRSKALLALIPTLIVLSFYIWRTKNLGGFSYGVRFFLALTPALFWMLIFFPEPSKRKAVRYLFRGFAVWSIIVAGVGIWKPTSYSNIGLNSFAVNIFQMQTKHAPTLSAKTWKILAQISGNKAETVGWIGDWLLSVNLAEPAKEALLQSLRGWESPLVYNDLGDIYYSRKDYSLALNYYKIADEKWEHRRSLRGLGYTYFQLKEYDSSVKYISRYLQMGDSMMAIAPYPLVKANQVYYQDNDRNSALILLAEGYIGEGLTDSAVSVLKQVETNDTNNPDYWIARALEGYIANDFVASGKAIEKALKPKPGLYRNLKEDPFLSEVIISQNIPPFDRNRR